MSAAVKRRAGPLLVAVGVFVFGVAVGGCTRVDGTSDTGNSSATGAPAAASGARGGLTGPAVTPAPAPPRGTQ